MASIKRAGCVFDELSIEAEWWFPNTPHVRVRGRVAGRPASELHLATEGNLGDEFHDGGSDKIILGESRTGERYTLLQCFATQRTGGFNRGHADYTYFAHWLLVGEHFQDYDALVFDRVTFGILNLEEWHAAKSFILGFDPIKRIASIGYTNPDPITLLDTGGVSATLEYTYRPSGTSTAQHSATIEHAARINLRSSSAIRLYNQPDGDEGTFFGHLESIKSFIEFATGTQSFPYDITAYSRLFPESSDSQYLRPIQIYRILRVPSNTQPVPNHKMLFMWNHMNQCPQDHFQAWDRTIRSLGMPVWLYLGSFREHVFADQRFLELAQALEGYHRFRHPKSSEKSEEHSAKVSQIIHSCPPEHREWLQTRLDYSHEPSLRSRLKELFDTHKGIVTWLTGSWSNAKQCITTIVQSRNHQSHCLDARDHAITGIAYNRTSRVIQAVLAALLLEDAGFSHSQIEHIITRNWGYRQLKERWMSDTKSEHKQKPS